MKEWKNKRHLTRNQDLPEIPNKLYFGIKEVSDLCAVKPHVLRYWEQMFSQLKPVKGEGNRRHYQYKDIELIRRIRWLLYEEGYTISGAKHKLRQHKEQAAHSKKSSQSVDNSQVIAQLQEVLSTLQEG